MLNFSRSWRLCLCSLKGKNKEIFEYFIQIITGDYGVLLGDSAYALRRYMLTPITLPETAAEEKYNKSLTITRARVEHTFGVLKNRFHSLLIPLRVMGAIKSCRVITAMLILHNIAVQNRDLYEPLPEGIDIQGSNADEAITATQLEKLSDNITFKRISHELFTIFCWVNFKLFCQQFYF